MQLKKFRVWNYKSFLDSGQLELGAGFNVLVGQNDSGKTALLEALTPNSLAHKPHRSYATAPYETSPIPANSRARFRYSASAAEVGRILCSGSAFMFTPELNQDAQSLLSRLLQQPTVDLEWDTIQQWVNPGFGIWNPSGSMVMAQWNGTGFLLSGGGAASIGNVFWGEFVGGVYRFKAERFNAGECAFGHSETLSPDAANLAEVLLVLQSNTVKFERYNELVRAVFPQIVRVTVQPFNNRVRVLVWKDAVHQDRIDLANLLNESGTGIGQVLAMLYVAYTAISPRVLLIDEPNSFLHPTAARALIEILREHPQHQYIISTHSPDMVVAARPSTVHILQMKEGQTKVQAVDAEKAEASRAILREVGARLSDVFGVDNVMWVEGATEEACFPRIIRKLFKQPPIGLAIVGVLQTGDFEGAKARDVVRIYERLSKGPALIPSAIAFVFDREGRSDKEIEDAKRLGGVHFLARRAFENYLLDPDAIAYSLNSHPPFSTGEAPKITTDGVKDWLTKHQLDSVYGTDGTSMDSVKLNGPKLLHNLFLDLSATRLEYRKTTHSVELTEWILENKPEELKEVADLLRTILAPAE